MHQVPGEPLLIGKSAHGSRQTQAFTLHCPGPPGQILAGDKWQVKICCFLCEKQRWEKKNQQPKLLERAKEAWEVGGWRAQ